ncbi:MAG TPA: sugar phosphate nucleotidyltransferase [Candidatus Binatia bacterium]|nr:sugar phosphate nucleotidyltransferase [Candidatus Binatia bacterium]
MNSKKPAIKKSPTSYALVLAGGEGKRLKSFIHLLRGDFLPKQYVNFIGRRSMLEHTWDRAEKLMAPSSIFTVVNRSHLAFPDVQRQIAQRSPGTVLVQPENKETATGIIFALLHIAKRCPNSLVTLLPSDHFILQEEEMMRYLTYAGQFVRRDPSRIVLLGIEPDSDESEYGYIATGNRLRRGVNGPFHITSFVEKPDYHSAQKLARGGALWNTMIMVFHTGALFELVRTVCPAIFSAMQPIYDAIGSPDEEAVTQEIYQDLLPINFSKEILEPVAHDFPSRLVAFPVRNVLWSDWGSETRVMEILRKIGYASRLNGLAHTADETEPRKDPHPPFAPRGPSVKRHDRAEEELSFASKTQSGTQMLLNEL